MLGATPILLYEWAGMDLFDFQMSRTTIQQCESIAKQMLKAVNAVHKDGFAHNDIKEQNIMVHERVDVQPIFMLTDLGRCEKRRRLGSWRLDLFLKIITLNQKKKRNVIKDLGKRPSNS